MSRSIQRDVPIVPWHSILSSIVAPQKSFAEALGVRGAELFTQVSREAHEAASGFSSSLWRDVYAGMNRDELDLAYNRALSYGASKHVAMALNAARDWPAGDIRAELLLRLNEEDKTCMYVCVKEQYIATARVVLQAALEVGVLERLVLMMSMGDAGCLEWSLFQSDIEMLKLVFHYVDEARRAREPGASENSCMSDLLQITITDAAAQIESCLSIAARDGDSSILELLINTARSEGILGLLLAMRCEFNSTCLHMAALYIQNKNVRLLLDAAQEVDLQAVLLNAVNDDGLTCLHMAMKTDANVDEWEVAEVAQTLLAAGGAALAMRKVPESDTTALHIAVQHLNPEAIRVLLDVGKAALLLQTSEYGMSALHEAVMHPEDRGAQCLRQLLIYAKNLDDGVLQQALLQKDEDGKTCFILAEQNHNSLSMSLILAYAREAGVARENLMN